MDDQKRLRQLPAVDKVLRTPGIDALKRKWLPALVDGAVREALAEARAALLAGESGLDLEPEALARRAGEDLARRLAPGMVRCINATGVVLHTGLGRAVLPPAAVEAIAREASGYCVVSIDREEGARIRRESAAARMLCALTGAEAATVVNNNAAATVIALNTFAAGREVILSRGQLVEIGGSFRMPDVFRTAGVTLREVGTTNRTSIGDYAAAIGEGTALLLRVHPSNYRVVGFTSEATVPQLVSLSRERGVPFMDDLGAGALVACPPEPEIAESLRLGSDLVTCSGDKLIGGPQAGLLLGRKVWIDRVRKNPLFRALRVDKLTLAALEATLGLFLRAAGPGEDHPTSRMLRLPGSAITSRARGLRRKLRRIVPGLGVDLMDGFSQVGSGSLPGEDLPTTLVTLAHPSLSASAFARALRFATPPVYTRIVDDLVCLDPRTLLPGDETVLLEVIRENS